MVKRPKRLKVENRNGYAGGGILRMEETTKNGEKGFSKLETEKRGGNETSMPRLQVEGGKETLERENKAGLERAL